MRRDDSVDDEVNAYLSSEEDLAEGYISSVRHKLLILAILLILAAFMAIFSMTINGRNLGFFEVIQVIIDHLNGATYDMYSKEWFDDTFIWGNSLPRMLFTIIAAIGLAVAGASMQSMMNNPLADPYTVGVSAGACLGLALSIILGLSINYGDSLAIILLSFIFALLPMAAIVFLAPKTRSSPSTLILAGVALSYLFNSVNTFILVAVDSETLSTIYMWQTGTLSSANWDVLPFVLLMVTAGSIVIIFLSRQLNLLALGDASASSLGVDPDNLRIICLVAIAFIVGAIVGCAGIIGFVGLVTPHMVRMVIGSDNRFVIPGAACLSILLMLIADMGCRAISAYDNIPIGAALSLIGAPIFLYLIIRRNSYVW
ncbi:MAG: iron ABC transporter permease [Candidatus Methanomethylophilaceae archaeon]|nr:iron ABC transporter permease [Candidatus Methanomethylophilaceae archaeon]